MDDCIFCKIVKGEIPSGKIYEDANFFAFLDIDPISKGHVLLVPKNHIKWIHEADDETVSKIFVLAKDFAIKMREIIPCDFVQLVVEGEQVPHLHVHLVPSFLGKKSATWKKEKYESQEEKNEYISKLTLKLKV